MPKVTFITLDGKEHEIEAEEGSPNNGRLSSD